MQALGLVGESVVHSGRSVREIRAAISEPTHFGAKLLLEKWWDRQSRGGIVMGRDLPSRELGCVLRNLAVYEPVDLGRDYRVRLAGAAFMRRFAKEIGGLRLSEFVMSDDFHDHRMSLCQAIVIGAPIIHDVRVVRGERVLAEFETMHLRILAPRCATSWVLGSLFYKDWT
ncbi:MAG: hypothetical protein ABSD74_00725 [Rhizomicrobium sp.]|jgi:hypothetical protein